MAGAKGAVAAGNQATAEAARIILAEGGNAFDAALAALCAACVAEPVLASMGGGGFLLARPAEGRVRSLLYDFFVQTPRQRRAEGVDFHPIQADFGETVQDFHIGLGAVATPGLVKGLFGVHGDLGRMPLTRIIEPALALNRDGARIEGTQAFVAQVVHPILMTTPEARAVFEDPDRPGRLTGEGGIYRLPGFGDFLDTLAREGEDLFYRGEIAAAIGGLCAAGGGHLTRDDMEAYQLVRRQPLAVDMGQVRLFTNPPPSSGGVLIAFALGILQSLLDTPPPWGSAEHLVTLVQAMAATDKARVDTVLHDHPPEAWEASLLDPALLADYAHLVHGRPESLRGTTHVSVVDGQGNAAAVTVSNGEGCGHMVPDAGFMLNNMLGEADINPAGFDHWARNRRMSSMMAPSIAQWPDGRILALGSGGSKRIRTAILQVLINRIVYGMDIQEAVAAPRLHWEAPVIEVEPGVGEHALTALAELAETRSWESPSMYFGGVHAVLARPGDGGVEAGADPRRGGVCLRG